MRASNGGLFGSRQGLTATEFAQSVWASSTDWADHATLGWNWQSEF